MPPFCAQVFEPSGGSTGSFAIALLRIQGALKVLQLFAAALMPAPQQFAAWPLFAQVLFKQSESHRITHVVAVSNCRLCELQAQSCRAKWMMPISCNSAQAVKEDVRAHYLSR
jgi:hypothetical protein